MSAPPISRVVVIQNPLGMHMRPAEMFARTAMKFQSRIEVIVGSRRIDGRSMIDLMTLAATQGTNLTLEAEGADAAEAVEALARLVEDGFETNEGQKTEPQRQDEHEGGI